MSGSVAMYSLNRVRFGSIFIIIVLVSVGGNYAIASFLDEVVGILRLQVSLQFVLYCLTTCIVIGRLNDIGCSKAFLFIVWIPFFTNQKLAFLFLDGFEIKYWVVVLSFVLSCISVLFFLVLLFLNGKRME